MRNPPAAIPRGQRVYAIGDVHGRLDLLDALVARIRADSEARGPAQVRVILLGDIIDRGPDSAELVARAAALARRNAGFTVLKGNHEAMMVHALRGNRQAFALWLRNGGDTALNSWGVPDDVLAEGASDYALEEARRFVPFKAIAWAGGLPTFVSVGDYLFVHAGIRPGVPLDAQQEEDMLWIRDEFLESSAAHPAVVVHGHSISAAPELLSHRIGVDTGAYLTGVLTAVGLEGEARWTLATDPDPAGAPAMAGEASARAPVRLP